MVEAVEIVLRAALHTCEGQKAAPDRPVSADLIDVHLVPADLVPAHAATTVRRLRRASGNGEDLPEAAARDLLNQAGAIVSQVDAFLTQ